MSILEQGLDRLGLSYTAEQLDKIQRYLDEVEFWNREVNLVRAHTRDELVVKHVLDSLAGLEVFRDLAPATLADAGSGAGLPGIPLAIFLQEVEMTLIERSSRKAAFLRTVKALLSLTSVTVIQAEIGTVGQRFDLVTARAFRNITEVIIPLTSLVAPKGELILYKGKKETIEQEMRAVEDRLVRWQLIPVEVPFLQEERNLVRIVPAGSGLDA
jgi:16S rRNA (guanine527-N7)-methyltransferase